MWMGVIVECFCIVLKLGLDCVLMDVKMFGFSFIIFRFLIISLRTPFLYLFYSYFIDINIYCLFSHLLCTVSLFVCSVCLLCGCLCFGWTCAPFGSCLLFMIPA